MENYKNMLSLRHDTDVLDFSKDCKFLLRSFPWSDTSEGHDFWKKYEEGSMDLHHSDIYIRLKQNKLKINN